MSKRLELIAREVLVQYPVKRAAFFGSAARNDMSDQSDIDMLVEFLPNTPGLDFFGLHVDLKEAFGRPVDLLTWDSLENAKPDFRYNVKREEKIIYEQQGA
ncbi:MAG: nucleotidyltransferase family protein [Defluviitaleaceae bacterium]|nr:nucleotidyltransferase family protein [Defluviitaleaceae bacterium]